MNKSDYIGFVHEVYESARVSVGCTAVSCIPEVKEHMGHHVYNLGLSPAQAATIWVYKNLPEKLSEDIKLVTGQFGIVPHTWLKIEGEITGVDTEGREFEKGTEFLVDVRQNYIIDPACPGVSPSCLLIHQSSQMWMMYREDPTSTKA